MPWAVRLILCDNYSFPAQAKHLCSTFREDGMKESKKQLLIQRVWSILPIFTWKDYYTHTHTFTHTNPNYTHTHLHTPIPTHTHTHTHTHPHTHTRISPPSLGWPKHFPTLGICHKVSSKNFVRNNLKKIHTKLRLFVLVIYHRCCEQFDQMATLFLSFGHFQLREFAQVHQKFCPNTK